MKLFGIEYQYLKWQCTLKLVQCTDNYCLCNEVCVGRQQNHFIIDKIILQNLTRIQELKIRFFITWLWKEDTIYLTKNRRKKKVSTFYLCRKKRFKLCVYYFYLWSSKMELTTVKLEGLLPVVFPYCTDSSMGKAQMSICLCNVRKLTRYIYIFLFCCPKTAFNNMIIDTYNIDIYLWSTSI